MTIEDEIAGFTHNPLGYAYYAYPWGEPGELIDHLGPREWQADILDAIGSHLKSKDRFEPLRIAVASGHGIGKSALIAMISQWGISTCEDCRIVVTANTGTQLDTKTWPEISKWFRLAINANWWDVQATSITTMDATHRENWRIDASTWSENNTEAFAGLHNQRKRIIVIYDEASAIAKAVWQVTNGALTDEDTEIIWIVFGNPTQNTGDFRECFGRNKHRWLTRQIDSRTVPGTNKKEIAKWIEDFGEDSDFVRIRVRGEFPRAGSSQFIAGDVVAAARLRKYSPSAIARMPKILVCDVARFGEDQTVIGVRQGPTLRILDKLRGADTVEVSARVILRIKSEQPRATVIDGDGIGGGVVDQVRVKLEDPEVKAKCPEIHHLHEFHGGAAPMDPGMYFNRRAEVWGMTRDWLETGSIPDDPELDADLTGPTYGFANRNGTIQLERKEDMKKRGLASPDAGDMLAMSFSVSPQAKTQDEALSERIAAIPDDTARQMARVRATLQRDARLDSEDYRKPTWME